TMACWVAERRPWKMFSREWRRVLNGPPRVREAHAKDMQARQGEFKGWTVPQIEALRLQLCRVIDRHVRFGVSVSVNRAEYEAIVIPKLPKRDEHAFGVWRDPYAWLMVAVMAFVMRQLKAGERVAFTFDRGHEGQGSAERLFYWAIDADS